MSFMPYDLKRKSDVPPQASDPSPMRIGMLLLTALLICAAVVLMMHPEIFQ